MTPESPYGEEVWEYSRWSNDNQEQSIEALRHFVVVPPTQSLEQALPRLQSLLNQGGGLWIFANGATLPGLVPAWLRRPGVLLSELGLLGADFSAYRHTREQVHQYFAELSDLAGCADLKSILLLGAYTRFLYEGFEAVPFVAGIRAMSKGRQIHFTCDSWIGVQSFLGPKPSSRFWGLRLAAFTVAGLLASVLRVFNEGRERRPLLQALRRERDRGSALSPGVWQMVHNEWVSVNPHLNDSIGLPWLRRGLPLGVLLTGDLLPGRRDHFTLRRSGEEFMAGLEPFVEYKDLLKIDQVVVPEGATATLLAWGRTLVDSLRLLLVTVRSDGVLATHSLTCSFGERVPELARLFSIDILRARYAAVAARQAIARNGRPANVFNTGSNGPTNSGADIEFQRQGIKTVDFCHGAGVEAQFPLMHTASSHSLVWLENDAEVLREQGHVALAAGMPVRHAKKDARESAPWNILVCSSYVHRDTRVGDFYPLVEFHRYLIRFTAHLEQQRPGQFRFRWRPHPADCPYEIERVLDTLSVPVERSIGTLAEDITWADGMVSNASSVIFEALLADLPTFVHILPRHINTRYAQYLHQDRKFFYIEQVVAALSACFQADTPPDRSPEAYSRRRFFGSSGQPLGCDAIWAWLDYQPPE